MTPYYIASEENMLKINWNTGEELWKHVAEDQTVYTRVNVDDNIDGKSDINILGEDWERVTAVK